MPNPFSGSTQDVDIVVEAAGADLSILGERLRSAGLYCDVGAISEAVAVRGLTSIRAYERVGE